MALTWALSTHQSEQLFFENHKSCKLDTLFIDKYIQSECEAGRYSCPFDPLQLEQLIGPFRTSPLGLVPKPGTDLFRMIQDLSFPRNNPLIPSINSEVNADDFPTGWGTFDETAAIILSLPPGCRAAAFDISAAYRITPVNPRQQNSLCIAWQGSVYVDRAVMFGLSSSAGVFGAVADMLVAIGKAAGFRVIQKWVDDFLVIQFPDQDWTEQDFIDLTAGIGVPWSASKTKPLSPQQRYIGFIWDLNKKTVTLPQSKIDTLLGLLDNWLDNSSKVTMKEASSLHGKLVHAASILEVIRPFLRSISHFAASFRSPRAHLRPPARVRADLSWVRRALASMACERDLYQVEPEDIGWWGDASTSFGIGVVVGIHWAAWRWRSSVQIGPGKKFDIGWAEAVAVELGLRLALHIHRARWRTARIGRVLVRSDNMGVVEVVNHGRSRNANTNLILQQIFDLQVSSGIRVKAVHVTSTENIADSLSRGIVNPSPCAIGLATSPTSIPLPSHLRPHLQQWYGH